MKHFDFDFRSTAIASMLFAAAAFTACTNPETETRQNPATDIVAKTDDGKRSVEQALDNLHQLLEIIDGKGTRARSRSIRSVEALSFEEFSPTTRADDGNTGDLVYIVNFENNAGYAILGADNRIAPVVAVTSKGSIGKQDLKFNPDAMKTVDGEWELFDPNEEDPEPDPKQSEYYCAEDDDFYLGADDDNENEFISRLLVDYLHRKPGDNTIQPIDGSTDGIAVYTKKDTIRIKAKLKTKWEQDEPFNNNVHEYEPGKRRPVGCTVTAAVQIFAYTKTPKMTKFGLNESDSIKWENMEQYRKKALFKLGKFFTPEEDENYKEDPDCDKYRDAIAVICKHMADNFPIHYNFCASDGSFATPTSVCRYMKKVGYNNAEIHRYYSKKNIISMLTNDKPVFIGAFGIKNLWKLEFRGHAWVIDGMIAETINEYNGSTLVKSEIIGQPLFHCNWGWGGKCDGYYTSEVFDTKYASSNVSIEDGIDDPDESSKTDDNVYFKQSSDPSYIYRHITY